MVGGCGAYGWQTDNLCCDARRTANPTRMAQGRVLSFSGSRCGTACQSDQTDKCRGNLWDRTVKEGTSFEAG